MDSSSSSLSSSWDIVTPSSMSKKSTEESLNEKLKNACTNRVDVKKCHTVRSAVDDINDAAISNQNESDIDVIEETDEDLLQMPVSTMKYSINSSKSSGSSTSSLPPSAPVPVEEWTMLFQLFKRLVKNSIQKLLDNSQIKNYHVIVFVSVILFSALLFHGTPSNEMKDEVERLKKENDLLKNQAISNQAENKKLFLILDEQIKEMRLENLKLSTPSNELKDQVEKLTKENDHLKNQAMSSKIESDKLILVLEQQIKAMRWENEKLRNRIEQESKAHRPEICGTSPNCFSNFLSCFSQTFLPRWW